jgi:hypothetical protein
VPLDVTPNISTVLALVFMSPLHHFQKYLILSLEQMASHTGFELVLGFGYDNHTTYHSISTLFAGTGC